jgi:NDP-sugar pyrophosphorylase family protein
MKTVLLATGGARELWPLTELTAAALLPIADKPLLVHAVESLAMAGLTDAIVIVDASGDAVKRILGDGTKWGMGFEYVTIKSDESLHDILRGVAVQLNQDYLLINGQVLRTPIISEFLTHGAIMKRMPITATIRGVPAGISILRQGSFAIPDSRGSLIPLSNGTIVDFPEARLALIESVGALHQANLDVVAGQFRGLILTGREVTPGVKLGRHSLLPAQAIKSTPVFVGARCRIAASAELMSHTVVSSDSVIDREATLYRAVIMPSTYVGALVEVRNAIVAGNLLIHVDTGAYVQVTDSFLISRIEKRNIRRLIRDLVAHAAHKIGVARSPAEGPLALRTDASDGGSLSDDTLARNTEKPDQDAPVAGRHRADRAIGL